MKRQEDKKVTRKARRKAKWKAGAYETGMYEDRKVGRQEGMKTGRY